MKKSMLAFLLMVAVCAGEAEAQNQEFRATWVVTWEWARDTRDVEAQKARIREILDNHVKANMNAVLWQVRQSGTAYYPSSYEPWGYYLGHQDPGFDPIAYAVEEAHKRGLEFHAWMNTFECRSSIPGTAVQEHPEWICTDGYGNPMPAKYTLSPGLAPVRNYLVQVAMEIVRNYDIDGLHLDYVRWSEYTTSNVITALSKRGGKPETFDGEISQEMIQELLVTPPRDRYLYDIEHPYSDTPPEGFATWEDWWRWSVTEFVRTLHDSIQAVKPWVRLSPAALGKYNWSGWNGYSIVFQDAALWFNEGYIDQLMGMHYHWTTASEFYAMLVSGSPNCWQDYIGPGIAAGRLYTVGPGSYRLNETNRWGNHQSIVETCRTVPWVDGFQFFSYDDWESRNYWKEAAQSLFPSKTKIRATGLLDSQPPPAPELILEMVDSLTYNITIIPAPGNPDGWFALYRSDDIEVEPDNDEIIALFFGHDSILFTDHFSGLQSFNGRYTYFATALDRFWNESNPSGLQITNPIPSFPPVVVATSPVAGDTVPVNSSLTIRFSKTMDTAQLLAALAISPAVPVAQVQWSADQKEATVVFGEPLQFATTYTVTIGASLTDSNGRPLDGNGDGIEGDPFSWQFSTQARDIVPPQIVESYPPQSPEQQDVEPGDILTIQFDEEIDAASVVDSLVILEQGQSRIDVAYRVFSLADGSVLCVQPLQPLPGGESFTFSLKPGVRDTAGNATTSSFVVNFHTSPVEYSDVVLIDPFYSTTNWASPGYSGSTVGIYEPNTYFKLTGKAYLPAKPVRQRSSAALFYQWDESSSSFLLREYLLGGPPRSVLFDTTYTLQCYVFGDGSGNLFRFAVDDSTKDRAEFHEVSKWITIDWIGWRLIEWPLNDPDFVGQWIGDGVLNGPSLRIDSFQLTHPEGATVSGVIYFDDLRLVRKSPVTGVVALKNRTVPVSFRLGQNYPNPFNPGTTIPFELRRQARVRLIIYDLLGREVARPVDGILPAGFHQVEFLANDLATGVYIIRLEVEGKSQTRRMTLIK